jgi:hypothetical protein
MDDQTHFPHAHPEQPQPIDAAALIGIYLELRTAKQQLEKQQEEALKPYTERMDKIEIALQKYMQDTRLNSLPTDNGTAYISVKRSASVADAAAFRGHVIETRGWDLADWRANVTAIETFVKEHGVVPPGVNWREFESVNVRRPTKGKD